VQGGCPVTAPDEGHAVRQNGKQVGVDLARDTLQSGRSLSPHRRKGTGLMNRQAMTTEPTAVDKIRMGSAETIHEEQVGLLLQGYASVFNERDSDRQYTTGRAYKALVDEWALPEDRRLLYYHGQDPRLGHRRIGKVLSHRITAKGLLVESFLPRDPSYHDADARARYREVYAAIKAGRIKGYSVEGRLAVDQGGEIYKSSVGELSVCPAQSGKSATFEIMPHGVKAAVDRALLQRAQKDDDLALHDAIVGPLFDPIPGVKHAPNDCTICLGRALEFTEAVYRAKTLLHIDAHLYG